MSLQIDVTTNQPKIQIKDNELVKPLIKFNGRIVDVFKKEIQSNNKLADLICRIATIIVAPLAYLVLSFVALMGLVKHAVCPTSKIEAEKKTTKFVGKEEIQVKTNSDEDFLKYTTETYSAISKELAFISSSDVKFLKSQGIEIPPEELNKKVTVYVQLENGSKETLVADKTLGCGGSKEAVQLNNGKALLIPNCTVDPLQNIQARWPRIVEEEVKMGEFLSSIGLFSLSLNKVKISLKDDFVNCVPAYMANSFESLKDEGIYVIDNKNESSTTLKYAPQSFKDLIASDDYKKWKPYLGLFIKDIAKLIYYNLPLRGDSFNLALVREATGDFKIRYLGFDFSSKKGRLQIPVKGKPELSKEEVLSPKYLSENQDAFKMVFESIFFVFNNNKYSLSKEMDEKIELLVKAFADDVKKALLDFVD